MRTIFMTKPPNHSHTEPQRALQDEALIEMQRRSSETMQMQAQDKVELEMQRQSTPIFAPPKRELTSELEPVTPIAESTHSQLMTPELFKPLEKWAEDFFNTPEQGVVRPGSEVSPANYLSHFGLKTPGAVARFILTPAGHTVTEQIAEKIAEDRELQEQRQMERREHDLLVHRIKMAMLLWYLSKKAHSSKKVNELILDQIEKAEKRLQKAAEQASHSPKADLQDLIKDYDKAIKAAQGQHHDLEEEGKVLEKDLALLMEAGEQLNKKYSTYDKSLNEISAKNFLAPDGSIDEAAFKSHHDELSVEMQKLQKELDQLIEEDQDPSAKLQELNALNLKFATMHDTRSISEGRKYSHQTTVDGQEAHFVLDKDDLLMSLNDDNELVALDPQDKKTHELDSSKLFFQKSGNTLVKDSDGKMYLLKAGQDLDTIKQNPQMSKNAQDAAKESFGRVKQEIMTVKHVIGHHKGMEKGANEQLVQKKQDLLSENIAGKELAANQVRLLQAEQADARNALRQIPAPKPSPNQQPGLGAAPLVMTPLPPTPRPTVSSHNASSQVPTVRVVMQLFKDLSMEKQRQDSLTQSGPKPGSPRPGSQSDPMMEKLKKGIPLTAQERHTRDMRSIREDVADSRKAQLGLETRAGADNATPDTSPKPNPLKTTPY